MDYYIDIDRKKRNTAGAKAPADISAICKKMGMKRFAMPMFPQERNKIYQKAWLLLTGGFYWMKLLRTVQKGDRVIYQHPMYGNRMALKMIPKIRQKKSCKFVVLIHDLESLRKGIEGVVESNEKTNLIADNQLLNQFDYVICHNEHMKQYLISQGFEPSKLICLGIFDYLSETKREQGKKSKKSSLAIAGNLAKGKSGYIYELMQKDTGVQIHLYGINFDETKSNSDTIYHGSFKPEELPDHLEGDFGLVWDGPSAESCVGNTGEYLKYNNPHKTSLYLSSNMPVIIWKKAAMADFVMENKVGIAVDNLYEVKNAIENISETEYQNLCENVRKISDNLKNGYYFREALENCH